MTPEEKIKELKRQYMRRWRAKNRDKVNDYNRDYIRRWRRKNPDKVKEYQQRYWLKKAEQMNFNHCPVCGETITGKAKFCSPACKQTAWRERQKINRNAEP